MTIRKGVGGMAFLAACSVLVVAPAVMAQGLSGLQLGDAAQGPEDPGATATPEDPDAARAEAAYTALGLSPDAAALEAFLAEFLDSRHAKEAEARLAELREAAAREARLETCQQTWPDLAQSCDRAALDLFVAQCQGSDIVGAAEQRLVGIEVGIFCRGSPASQSTSTASTSPSALPPQSTEGSTVSPAAEAVVDKPELDFELVPVSPRDLWATQSVNVRSVPASENNTPIGQVRAGAKVRVTAEVRNSPWRQIAYGGATAFLHGGYLTEAEPTSPEPGRGGAEEETVAAVPSSNPVTAPAAAPSEDEPKEEVPWWEKVTGGDVGFASDESEEAEKRRRLCDWLGVQRHDNSPPPDCLD